MLDKCIKGDIMKIEGKYDWLYDIFTDKFCQPLDCDECPCYRDCHRSEGSRCSEIWRKYLERKLEQ